MLTLDAKVTPDPEVLYTELDDGEAVLFYMPTSLYFSLNPTGTRIWQLMGKGLTVGEIGQKLVAEYDVAPEAAQQSVLKLAQELIAANLLSIQEASDPEIDDAHSSR